VFGLALHLHPLGFECGVDRHRFNRPEKLPRNSGLNPHSTEDQTPRPWPSHHAAGGAAKIIIDDLDIPKSSPPRFIDQVILPALALVF